MPENSPPINRPVVVGANHRSSSMALRDRLFVEEAMIPDFLKRLKKSGVSQAIMLSTCDRVEVQAIDTTGGGVEKRIAQVMAEHAGLSPSDLGDQVYTLWGADAVRQIFLVSASLDSLMIGEPQVLGQVKDSHRMSQEASMSGSELEALMQSAYTTAKRVRSETAIGQRPVSMAAVAAQLAKDIHGDLSRCRGLLIGGGDMGELVAETLISSGLGHLTAIHPTEARGEAVARTLDCHVASFEELNTLLLNTDIVLTSIGARNHILDADLVEKTLRKRRFKPIFLVDTGVPGDVDPAVNQTDEAFLYDLNDLERVAMEGRASRESEVGGALKIINEEVDTFMRGRTERTAVPVLSQLRTYFEEAREEALADANNDAEKATRLLIRRLLHDPSKAIREMAADEDLNSAEDTLRRLFNLDKES